MALKTIGLFKFLSIFGIVVMIILLFGPAFSQLGSAAREGQWGGMLKIIGGRLFVIESTINQETTYLLESEEPVYQQVYHLTYVLTLLFMIFFVAVLLFKFMNWLSGKGQLEPSTDIAIVALIILSYLLIEFLYSYFVLGTTVIPVKDGLVYFFRNLPTILNKMFM